jgi:hypothetical protein
VFYEKDRERRRYFSRLDAREVSICFFLSSSSLNKQVFSATKPLATMWHDRLGQPSFEVIQWVLRNYEFTCSNKTSVMSICDSCQRAKVINSLIQDPLVCPPSL